jgi:hypothetical protein
MKYSIDNYVLVNNKYIGKIIKIVWNYNGYIIKLEFDSEYQDKTLSQYQLVDLPDKTGLMLLTLNDDIKLIKLDGSNLDYLSKFYSKDLLIQLLNKVNGVNQVNQVSKTKINETDRINKINPFDKIYKPKNYLIYRFEAGQEDDYVKYITKIISDLFISDSAIKWEEDFYLGSYTKSYDTLGEKNIDAVIKPTLINVLEYFNPIDDSHTYDFKNTLMYKHLIYDDNIDTLSLGKELIGMIKTTLINLQKLIEFDNGEKLLTQTNLFDFIKFRIVGAHIEIIPTEFIKTNGSNSYEESNVITNELVPNLQFMQFQYSKPIDYSMLLPIVLDNKTPQDIQANKPQIDEALKIMSQEYIIGFQPNVDILLWVIARIIISWYADPILYKNIIKIKILINMFRARGSVQFNRDQGIQPLIQVIPRYGKKNVLKVLSHLSYFFFPYKKLGWKYSDPTWFDKVDNLMYYTNGSLELKKYVKFLLEFGSQPPNPFVQDMSQINDGTDNKVEYTKN